MAATQDYNGYGDGCGDGGSDGGSDGGDGCGGGGDGGSGDSASGDSGSDDGCGRHWRCDVAHVTPENRGCSPKMAVAPIRFDQKEKDRHVP